MIYSGLMIGGPMDGKMLSHGTERWDYHKSPESLHSPIDYSDMNDTKAATKAIFEGGHYYYTDVAIFGAARRRRIGFWVEHDKNIDDAIDAILARYQEPRKHRDLLKRAGRTIFNIMRQALCLSPAEFIQSRDMLAEIESELDETPY